MFNLRIKSFKLRAEIILIRIFVYDLHFKLTFVILQCSEYTPLSTVALASLLKEAGFPGGVVNIVAGDGSVGANLTSHENISKISFTGSVPTGKRVS